MTKRSEARQSRRAAAREAQTSKTSTRWLIPVVVVIIVGAALGAVVLSQSGSAGESPSPAPSATDAGPPVIGGDPLPTFSNTVDDPAVGLIAPSVAGHDDAGDAVSIAPDGTPTLVLFAAHWCPHCQRELPLIQTWLDGGGMPPGVDLVTVSTGIDATAPNYPPAAWFERIGWTAPVIVDSTGSVATAYGLSAYPFFVMLDGEGHVVARSTGELTIQALEDLIGSTTETP
jgi:thiol-disulfide isomerase/thioredoxin